MFSTENLGTTKEKIEYGRKFIEEIKKQNLGEKRTKVNEFISKQDKDVQQSFIIILDRLKEAGLDICTGDITAIQEIFDEEKRNFRERKLEKILKSKNISPEQGAELMKSITMKSAQGFELNDIEKEVADEVSRIGADVNKISTFAANMVEIRENTIDEITKKIRDYFIDDLIDNSRNSAMPQLSEKGWRLYFGIKSLNYGEIVQYSNWDYQTEIFPSAISEIIEKCAESLVESGAIRNKFYDTNIGECVTDEQAKKHMITQFRPETTYDSYKNAHGIKDIKSSTTPLSDRYTGSKEQHEKMEMSMLFQNLYRFVQDRDESFADIYLDTYYAVETKIRNKVEEMVLVPELEEPEKEEDSKTLKERKKKFRKHFFKKELKMQIDKMRQEILDIYGTLDLTQEQKEEFIAEKTAQERKTMERKIALQLSIYFVAQMTDRSFEDIAKATGHLPKNLRETGLRGTIPSDQVNEHKMNIDNQVLPTAHSSSGEER